MPLGAQIKVNEFNAHTHTHIVNKMWRDRRRKKEEEEAKKNAVSEKIIKVECNTDTDSYFTAVASTLQSG